MAKKIVVTIVTITYNHEKYIEEALKSFLSQKVDFDYEVIVADDASIDRTQEIVKSYSNKYPHIFKPILRTKNIGAQNNCIDALKAAKGKYIALCEGDDYWTDNNKLQKQVDLMDAHAEYTLCFHPVRVVTQGRKAKDEIFPNDEKGYVYDVKELLRRNYIQTNSVMYRKKDYVNIPNDILPLDWYLHLLHAQYGKIGFLHDTMSVYRRHPGGLWWDARDKPSLIWEKHGYNYLLLLHQLMLLYGSSEEHKKIIDNHIAGSYEAIALIDKPGIAAHVAARAIKELPLETWDYIKHLMQQVAHYSKHDAYLQDVVEHEALQRAKHEQIILQLNEETIKPLKDELIAIKATKAWKVVDYVHRSKIRVVRGIRRKKNRKL